MSQLKLITESEWTPTELLMTLHAKVDRLQEDQQHMVRMLATVLAAVQDDPATLHKLIRGLSVVPFEDEGEPIVPETPAPLPVLASCPCCENKEAHTEAQVEELFGYRTMEDGKVRVQSWCRECRGLEAKTSPRSKQPLPAHVRELGQKARRLLAEASKLEVERNTLLQASSGRETKQTIALSAEIAAKRTASVPLMAQYEAERSIIRKAKGTK